MGVGGKSRGLVKDGVPVDRLHGLADPVIPMLKVTANFLVRALPHAGGSEGCIAQEGCEFQHSEVTVSQDAKRISQQFFRAGPKGFKVPALLQDLGELFDGVKTSEAGLVFENIQADGIQWVARLDDEQSWTKINSPFLFLFGDASQNVGSGITVMVKKNKSPVLCDILGEQVFQK